MRWRYGRTGGELTLTDHNDAATTTNQQSTTREIRTKTHINGNHNGNGYGGAAVVAEKQRWAHSYVDR